MTTISEVINAIGKIQSEDLLKLNRIICEEIKQRNRMKNAIAKANFVVGDSVHFIHSSTGQKIEGKISKIKQKNILINSAVHGNWNVPASRVIMS